MRPIKQIISNRDQLVALCEDHTLWSLNQKGIWEAVPEIPSSTSIMPDPPPE